jgi:hypothetical protein
VVNLAGNVLHAHEEYVLAEDNLQILDNADIPAFMHWVIEYVEHNFHIPVRSICHHPFGIGLYQLDTTFHKDLLMAANPHNIDGIDVSFINHSLIMIPTTYSWIMLLGYPLDYRNLMHIDQAIFSFGKLVTWHNNRRALGYVVTASTTLRNQFMQMWMICHMTTIPTHCLFHLRMMRSTKLRSSLSSFYTTSRIRTINTFSRGSRTRTTIRTMIWMSKTSPTHQSSHL